MAANYSFKPARLKEIGAAYGLGPSALPLRTMNKSGGVFWGEMGLNAPDLGEAPIGLVDRPDFNSAMASAREFSLNPFIANPRALQSLRMHGTMDPGVVMQKPEELTQMEPIQALPRAPDTGVEGEISQERLHLLLNELGDKESDWPIIMSLEEYAAVAPFLVETKLEMSDRQVVGIKVEAKQPPRKILIRPSDERISPTGKLFGYSYRDQMRASGRQFLEAVLEKACAQQLLKLGPLIPIGDRTKAYAQIVAAKLKQLAARAAIDSSAAVIEAQSISLDKDLEGPLYEEARRKRPLSQEVGKQVGSKKAGSSAFLPLGLSRNVPVLVSESPAYQQQVVPATMPSSEYGGTTVYVALTSAVLMATVLACTSPQVGNLPVTVTATPFVAPKSPESTKPPAAVVAGATTTPEIGGTVFKYATLDLGLPAGVGNELFVKVRTLKASGSNKSLELALEDGSNVITSTVPLINLPGGGLGFFIAGESRNKQNAAVLFGQTTGAQGEEPQISLLTARLSTDGYVELVGAKWDGTKLVPSTAQASFRFKQGVMEAWIGGKWQVVDGISTAALANAGMTDVNLGIKPTDAAPAVAQKPEAKSWDVTIKVAVKKYDNKGDVESSGTMGAGTTKPVIEILGYQNGDEWVQFKNVASNQISWAKKADLEAAGIVFPDTKPATNPQAGGVDTGNKPPAVGSFTAPKGYEPLPFKGLAELTKYQTSWASGTINTLRSVCPGFDDSVAHSASSVITARVGSLAASVSQQKAKGFQYYVTYDSGRSISPIGSNPPNLDGNTQVDLVFGEQIACGNVNGLVATIIYFYAPK